MATRKGKKAHARKARVRRHHGGGCDAFERHYCWGPKHRVKRCTSRTRSTSRLSKRCRSARTGRFIKQGRCRNCSY